MKLDFKNKTVLILGCSSGIGAQTARIFLENNWKVIGHYNKNKKKSSNYRKNMALKLNYLN